MNHVIKADASELDPLTQRFGGAVTLAYLDPPFNTGNRFRNYRDSMSRSAWLGMMGRCLMSIRDMLTPDGSVWVHLDDSEDAYYRVLADEIFGADCYVGTVVWHKKYKAGNSLGLSTVHNTITVHSRLPRWQRKNGLPPNAEHTKKYRNPDNDPLGPWRLTPAGIKTYLSDLTAKGAMPHTWWDYDESGHTETGTKESRALFGGDGFDYPKPEILLERVITIGSNPGDLVFDPFGGSGTTAAVAHRLGRRFVTSEILQETVDNFIRPRLDGQGAKYELS